MTSIICWLLVFNSADTCIVRNDVLDTRYIEPLYIHVDSSKADVFEMVGCRNLNASYAEFSNKYYSFIDRNYPSDSSLIIHMFNTESKKVIRSLILDYKTWKTDVITYQETNTILVCERRDFLKDRLLQQKMLSLASMNENFKTPVRGIYDGEQPPIYFVEIRNGAVHKLYYSAFRIIRNDSPWMIVRSVLQTN